ncbi:MAG: aconitate hydratase, partial [Planctomycetes bacterium]|nr:aconitate hydratase [Planctomycetota bacterium]
MAQDMAQNMAQNIVQKIIAAHLVDGEMTVGGEIGLRIDQTLTQDATGTTVFLLLEAMGTPRTLAELSVSYVDHNLSQFGPENHVDHLYLQSIATKLGSHHSRAGNGICHQVHLERFARPGKTLIGSDSHTPTAGGMGMLAMGAGGLDVAVAMGGGAFYIASPRVIGVELRGSLGDWVAAKDIILRLLSILTTRGNVGCCVEYFGEGVAALPVPARATCTNMGAELGVTTSIFPADEVTEQFLRAQGRGDQYAAIAADSDAGYDRITKRLDADRDAAVIANIQKFCTNVEVSPAGAGGVVEASFDGVVIDLGQLEPMAAGSPSPDNVSTVAALAGRKIAQVVIGSCTNSSYQDLMTTAAVLKGRTVHPDVELGIAPGSRQVMNMLIANGAMSDLISAGARILESGCGPCIGLGFSPAGGTVSLRTFNRNFAGRSGTTGDEVYLVSPETAVAAALTGEITDPRELTALLGVDCPHIAAPQAFDVNDNMILPPLSIAEAADAPIIRGATIVKPPLGQVLPQKVRGEVIIKVGDKITTDHIMPAGPLLKYRSNVPKYAEYVFNCFNEPGQATFAQRCLAAVEAGRSGIIVAGESYGQGSSREHAALCPMYLGIAVVVARSIERMHQANLVNFGILPLTFAQSGDYERIRRGDELVVSGVTEAIASGESVTVRDATQGFEFVCGVALAPRQRKILSAGGLLNYTRRSKQCHRLARCNRLGYTGDYKLV